MLPGTPLADGIRPEPATRRLKRALRPAVLGFLGARPFSPVLDRRGDGEALVTVDAFDTLVTRIVRKPADVFLVCGRLLRERDATRLDAAGWRDRRVAQEARLAAAAHPREVTLAEIYDALVAAGDLPAAERSAALELEREVERRVSRPIAPMIAAMNRRTDSGLPVRVLSDTYLPEADLHALLLEAGLRLAPEMIHASSRTGRTKRGGELFDTVLVPPAPPDAGAIRAEGTRPWRLRAGRPALHVGDNLDSDWRRARAAGLRAAPYLAGGPNRYERALAAALPGEGLTSAFAGAARSARLGRHFPDAHRQAVWDSSADVTGPLLFSFVAWVLSEARARGLRTLYFLARDGEILLQVARRILDGMAASGEAPAIECRYLYASRRSLHLPGVVVLGPTELDWIFEDAGERSLDAFLARADIRVEEFLPLLDAASPLRGRDPGGRLSGEEVGALRAAFGLAAVQALVLDRAAARRATCLDYMRGEGLLDPGAVGIVDIGWKGRLQRSLCRVAQTVEPGFADRLHGFYIDLDRRPEGAGRLSTFSEVCRSGRFRWAARGALFEVFCAAGHGTVTGYAHDPDGRIGATLAEPGNPAAERWGLAVQQAAVTRFAEDATAGLRLLGFDPLAQSPALARATLAAVRLFVEQPGRAEAEAYGRFRHAADEGHGVFEEMAGRIDLRPWKLARRLGPAYRDRRISFWPEASVSRTLSGPFRPLALSLLQNLPGRRG